MNAAPPTAARSEPRAGTDGARLRMSWWMGSLLLHSLVLGLLFLLLPPQAPTRPADRRQETAPAVSRNVLEATTRKIERKQSAEMARKLAELESLAGAIKNAEQAHRKTHAAFEAAFVQLTPELARDLGAQAAERLRRLDRLIQDDQALWLAAEQALSAAAPALHEEKYAGLKPALASLEAPFLRLTPSQHALNFGQAGLFETQRQIADRLAFLKTKLPELAEKQAALTGSWETVMSLGADYAKRVQPLTDHFGASARTVDLIVQQDRSIEDRARKLATSRNRLAKQEAELGALRASLAKLQEEQARLDPADTRRAKRNQDELKRVNEGVARLEGSLKNEQKEETFLARILEESRANRRARMADLAARLAAIRPAFDALAAARADYERSLRETMAAQKSLEPAMRAALPAEPPDAPPQAG